MNYILIQILILINIEWLTHLVEEKMNGTLCSLAMQGFPHAVYRADNMSDTRRQPK